jgi:hypothetical protein
MRPGSAGRGISSRMFRRNRSSPFSCNLWRVWRFSSWQVSFPSEGSPPIMVWMGGGVLLLQLLISQLSRRGGTSQGVPVRVIVFLTTLSMCGIAIGNHVRKRHPDHPAPRKIAGFCGIFVMAVLLVPIGRGAQPFALTLFEQRAWQFASPLTLAVLVLTAYAFAGIVSFKRFGHPRRATRWISLMGWLLLSLFPISLLGVGVVAFIGAGSDGESAGPVILMIFKSCALGYGLLILPAAGAAAWLSTSLAGAHSGARHRPRLLLRPPAPVGGPVTPSKLPTPPPSDVPPDATT